MTVNKSYTEMEKTFTSLGKRSESHWSGSGKTTKSEKRKGTNSDPLGTTEDEINLEEEANKFDIQSLG